ncbi:MAG: phosphoribosyltransferase [Andreesenia angusta]|nr:phosphoribosyltransferase [Andreesenia angusta]
MAKHIVISDLIINKLNDSDRRSMINQLNNLEKEGNAIIIVDGKREEYADSSNSFKMPTESEFMSDFTRISESIVFVSGRDDMFETSRYMKSLFICPMWIDDIGENASRYGVQVRTPKQMYQIIKHSNNNNFWHTRKKLKDGTIFYSLLDAKFRYFSTSSREDKMIENFESTIYGDETTPFFDILKYDLQSAISNKLEYFDDIDIWTIFPNSSKELDKNMMELKKSIEINSGVKLIETDDFSDNLILRHTEKDRAHDIPLSTRITNGSAINLETICLNPAFKDHIEGSTICVIDDFLNHGFSFEAARNLLKAAGAKQIILLALGTYTNDYLYKDYEIKGDPFNPNFEFSGPNYEETILNPRFKINPQAKVEVETLFTVFNSSW